MSARIAVPPATMERVEYLPTSVVPRIRRLEVPDLVHQTDVVRPNALTFGAALIEAVASSRIEGIDVTVTQAALAYFQPRHPDVTRAGTAVAAALHATLAAAAQEATYRDHRASHDRLMRGQGTGKFAGGYRKRNVRISDHIAPAPRRVPELMADLVGFVGDRAATVVNGAIAHAQFECIHPYPDGNGRMGRALLTGHLGVPVSRHLARHRQDYYDALRDYRLGDATPIVDLVGAAAVDGFELIESTFGDEDPWDSFDEAERRVAARARQHPVGTPMRMLRGSSDILWRGFTQLRRRGIIVEASAKSPHTVYAYLPAVRTWIGESGTNLYATHYEDSWKRELRVHL